jgi:hypothetical protein
MNLGDSLPAIRVPKSILAELSTGSLLSQKA